MSLLLYVVYTILPKRSKCKFFNKMYTVHFCFFEKSVNQVGSQKQQMLLYVLFLLCTPRIGNAEYNEKKMQNKQLLTDKTKKIDQSIFCYLHM